VKDVYRFQRRRSQSLHSRNLECLDRSFRQGYRQL